MERRRKEEDHVFGIGKGYEQEERMISDHDSCFEESERFGLFWATLCVQFSVLPPLSVLRCYFDVMSCSSGT